MDILSLAHLSVTYDERNRAVDDVSLTVGPGDIVTLVGESGSGKSTLLHAVLGLLPRNASVTAESFCCLGHDFMKADARNRRRIRGSEISMIFQDAGRYMNPTERIGKQYRTFLKSHGRFTDEQCDRTAAEHFRKLRLQDAERILRAYPFELSGGMCQRVAIAMAMTLSPRLLLADEPTSALDVTVQAQVIHQMMEMRKQSGAAILLVTHNMGIAAYISDYIGVMQDGKMIEYNKAQDLITHPREAYTKTLLDAVIELGDEQFGKQ